MFDYTSLSDEKLILTYKKLMLKWETLFITELYISKIKREIMEEEMRKRGIYHDL